MMERWNIGIMDGAPIGCSSFPPPTHFPLFGKTFKNCKVGEMLLRFMILHLIIHDKIVVIDPEADVVRF